ncbi:RNA-directed DNA polymerase, eukaryota [Tanacetum coccineum]
MIGISLNCNGLGKDSKKGWIKELIDRNSPAFIGIQETKLKDCDVFCVRSFWPRPYVDFIHSDSVGASGGILTVWDSRVFSMESQFVDCNFIVVIGTWAGISIKVGLLNVYAPQSSALKASLWFSIESLLSSYNVTWIVFGDFNVVRYRKEHSGSGFNDREANVFNDFIARNGLFDFPFGGRKLPRFDKEGKKASKLDRFLVGSPNFGPKLFKVFDKWNIDVEFRKLVLDSWDAASSPEELTSKLVEWDIKAEAGLINEVDVLKREEWIMDLNVLDQIQRDDFQQKCVLVNGSWLSSPDDIKQAVIDHFSSRFKEFDFWNYIKLFEATGYISNGSNPSFVVLIPKKADPLGFLDYRPISLISCVYKVIAKLLSTWLARVIDSIIGPNQSSFVKGRKILDGCLMTNEIIRMATLEDHKLLLFKVDFEKAFDSVNWEFLLVVIRQMERGLRKGNPLSPLLFLLVAEALQVTILEACKNGVYNGVFLTHSGTDMASSLKVNIAKSRFYRVGVSRMDIDVVASSLGCDHGSLLFIYLRSLVGRKINRNGGWNEAPKKVIELLEYIRSRFFWGYKDSKRGIYKEMGGLGVGCLHAKNLGLLDTSVGSATGGVWCEILKAIIGVVTDLVLWIRSLDCMLSSPSNIARLVIDGFSRMAFGVAIGLGVLLRADNLSSRGIVPNTSLCPLCDLVLEDIDHSLIRCPFVSKVWKKVWCWWNLTSHASLPSFSISDVALDNIPISDNGFSMLSKVI